MKQSNVIPLALLIGGVLGALYCAVMQMHDTGSEYAWLFAVACVVAVIGWGELNATNEFNENN